MTLVPQHIILQSPASNDPLLDLNTQPSLDLQFAAGKTLDDRVSGNNLVTFSRASTGTYVDSDGLIKTSPVNLVTYSEQFDQWTVGLNTTVSPNVAVAPDGTQTADRLQNGSQSSTFIGNGTINNGVTYTVSVYAKAVTPGTNDKFTLNVGGDTANSSSQFTTTSEWQRFVFTRTVSSVSPTPYFFINNEGDGFASDIYIWGAQLEEGSTATTYIPTTATNSGAPRFDHDPVTGESLGLLIEESRTNVVVESTPGGTDWVISSLVETLNATAAPDGTVTATKYEAVTPSDPGSMRVYTYPISGGPTIARTGTIFAKAGTTDQFFIRGLENNGTIVVDLNTGIVSSNSSLSTVNTAQYPDGWWRISVTVTSPEAILYCSVASGLSGSFYIWGAQIEAGLFPTSYIPTTSSTVTRAADVASITGTNFSSWFNQSEGTVFVDRTFNINNGQTYYFTDSTLTANRIRLEGINHSGNNSSDGSSFNTAAASNKTALGLQTDNVSVNGGTPDTSFTMPSSLDRLFIGRHPTVSSSYLNGHIARLAYYPYRLADATLQEITS
jgi:hypothetical protein